MTFWTSLVAQTVKCLPTMWETRVQSLGWEDLLEKEMATQSSTLAWKIPWTEEPGRLQFMGSQRVRRDWATDFTFFLSFFLENCWCHYSFRSLVFLAVLDRLCFLDAPLIATSRGHSPCLCLAHYCGGLSCFVSKGLSSQSCGFSSGHVWMWELD